jgi:predicted nucleic acid-binding protein
VTRTSRKYVLDTQLFIHGFRDRAANEALQQFHRVFAPFEYLSVIVAQELRSGVQRPEDRKALERHVLNIFERANRTITPSTDAWHRSGDLLAQIARKEGFGNRPRVQSVRQRYPPRIVVPRGGLRSRNGQRA